MKLLQFIRLQNDNFRASLSKSTLEKNRLCANRLTDFLRGEDVDIRKAQDSKFVKSFVRYLEGTYSYDTIFRTIRDLRKFVRAAIKEQIIANVDVFPAILKSIATRCSSMANSELNLSEVSRQRRTKENVERLTNMIAKWAAQRPFVIKSSDPTEYRRQREADYNLRCAAVYLFGLMHFGCEIEDALRLEEMTNTTRCASGIYPPPWGSAISPTAARLAAVYNGTTHTPGCNRIFNILNGAESTDEIEHKASTIKSRISRFMGKERLDLYKGGSVFNDWVSLAMECGMSAKDGEQLIAAQLAGQTPADGIREKANDIILSNIHVLDEHWYLLRVYTPRLTATKLKRQLLDLGVLGDAANAKSKVYDPIDALTDRRSTGNPLSRMLFFKSTGFGCAVINNAIKGAAVLRNTSTKKFAEIKQEELEAMQYVLRDFRDDVELINKSEWLAEQQSRMKIGGEVKILDGALAGRTATIVEIKDTAQEEKSYLLEFAEGNITFKTKLTGVKLQVLE